MSSRYSMNTDLLIVSCFFNENDWKSANKSSYQRVLYFTAALSPIFVPHEEWEYSFSNTIFGPYNDEIAKQLNELFVKGLLLLEERKKYSNRIEERYKISEKGIKECKNKLFLFDKLHSKINWIEIIVKALSIYGENFLAKIIKEDPNVISQNMDNIHTKIITDDSEENITKEFFSFLRSKGKEKIDLEIQNDQEYLLLFFDVLYRKYKGGGI